MSIFFVPAYETMPNIRDKIDELYRVHGHRRARDPDTDAEARIACTLMEGHSKLVRRYKLRHNDVLPSQFPATDGELVETLLLGTPYYKRFTKPVSLPWENRDRFAHTHIIGRTRAGKTTLMEHMIAHDLQSPQQPSVVVMTPHRELIRDLKGYASTLGDRLVLVDPSDENYPPAINPFHSMRPVRANHVIETFDYILASLELELTPKQQTLWNYSVRMLLAMPKARKRNATILDIMQFLLKPESYTDVIDALPEHDREFFYDAVVPETTVQGRNTKTTFDSTREEIGYRLRNVLFNDAARDVLSATETKIDFFEELNRGSVILVDTAKSSIGDASTVFGGMVLALIFQAMLGRDDHDRSLWRPTFVYVDECANYMSEDIAEMLTELRKFNCGLILAHHDLSQASKRSAALEASIISQPAIRFAHPSAADAPRLAKEMRTTPEFLGALPEYHFAHYIHGVTPHAMAVTIQPAKHPKASEEASEVFKRKNRGRVSAGKPSPEASAGLAIDAGSPQPDTDGESREW